jgi:GT2 family glycosyltransferase
MKVIISLTTIPSRFQHLQNTIKNLENQTCHEIWVNIPRTYQRFPEWDGIVPPIFGSKLKINRECEDLGPGTKFMGPAHSLDPEDLIVYLDDDTNYDSKLVTNLLKWHRTDPKSAWGRARPRSLTSRAIYSSATRTCSGVFSRLNYKWRTCAWLER